MAAAKNGNNLQEVFLNSIRKDRVAVTVFLVNGIKLQGTVTWFDSFCVLLRREQHVQLVYKHAISTIMPSAPIKLDDGGPPSEVPAAAEVVEEGA